MDLEILAASALGCSIGLMFKTIVDAIEGHYRLKMMIAGALENEKIEKGKKKTQK